MDTLVTLLLSALIPLVIGFVWYHPKVFGNFWMRVAGVTEEKLKTGNFVGILVLTYVFGFMLSAILMSVVIHQSHVYSIFAETPDGVGYLNDFMAKYGNNFRTFKHGLFHGVLTGIFVALPIVAINAMFERRGTKYVLVHFGYWTVTLGLMGGVICQFAMRS